MKKITRFVVILLILAGALAIFKPNEKNFESWVKTHYANKRGNAKGDNILEKLADKGVQKLTEIQVIATYRYHNHYFFATVDATANAEDLNYLGVAGIWIPLP